MIALLLFCAAAMKNSFDAFAPATTFPEKREGGVENLRFFCGFAPYFYSIIERILPSFFLRKEFEEGRMRY